MTRGTSPRCIFVWAAHIKILNLFLALDAVSDEPPNQSEATVLKMFGFSKRLI